MSLKPAPCQAVPEKTARVARAAFPKGNPYLQLRDEFGTIFHDDDFVGLYPRRGQPAYAPWRLALVTILQFKESLTDRGAANAVRARIDWKYLLGLALDDPGFDFSVLSEFRDRLLAGEAEEMLLHKLLDACREKGLLKARGRQRTDATHVLASVRALSRLELIGETMRAALNELAHVAPEWLRAVAPEHWYKRYGPRIDEIRLPKPEKERQAYASAVGADGFLLLDALGDAGAPAEARSSEQVQILRQVWARHFERGDGREGSYEGSHEGSHEGHSDRSEEDRVPDPVSDLVRSVRYLPSEEVGRKGRREKALQKREAVESPYDVQARHRTQQGKKWTGYMVHLSETCDQDRPHFITHTDTTTAAGHEVGRLPFIHEALAEQDLLPQEHLVDSAYVSASNIVESRQVYGIDLIGPARRNPSWQRKRSRAGEQIYDITHFAVDWENEQVRCPQGHKSNGWKPYPEATGGPFIRVWFSPGRCQACPAKAQCTRSKKHGRQLALKPREQHEALMAVRALESSDEGGALYALRSGIEGTISQGVRVAGLRKSRYVGLPKTHLQHVATAAAINLERLGAWLRDEPRASTRMSRFAALAA